MATIKRSNLTRLNKYKRKKMNAKYNPKKWDRLAMLYWRYWFKVHSDHEYIWPK